jgi:hypothetical protein
MTCANRYSFDAKSKVSTWLIEETDVQQDCSVQSRSGSEIGTTWPSQTADLSGPDL